MLNRDTRVDILLLFWARQLGCDTRLRRIFSRLFIFFVAILCQFKECMSDSVTKYNYVGDTKISALIKKPNANKCTLSEIFKCFRLLERNWTCDENDFEIKK